jgi:hypothetical protein
MLPLIVILLGFGSEWSGLSLMGVPEELIGRLMRMHSTVGCSHGQYSNKYAPFTNFFGLPLNPDFAHCCEVEPWHRHNAPFNGLFLAGRRIAADWLLSDL